MSIPLKAIFLIGSCLIFCIFFLSIFFVSPLIASRSQSGAYAERLLLLSDRTTALQERLAKTSNQETAVVNVDSFLHDQKNVDLVSEIQTVVRSLLIESGAVIEVSQAFENSFSNKLTKVSVVVRCSLNDDGLRVFLQNMAKQIPPLFIENMEIQYVQTQPGRLPLNMTATIYGVGKNAN